MSAAINKSKQDLTQETEEPKSAHATPVVEKYVRKRKNKADRQIDKEQQ